MTPPTAEEQVAFLANIQRLLAEGSFVATYKYALLLALADLSVERGDDTGAALSLSTSAIAEKVLISYWRQACPYPSVTGLGTILKQNTGKQAAIVRLIVDARARSGGSLAAAKANTSIWKPLVVEVAEIVRRMPLWKLQRIGDHVLDFLYPNIQGHANSVELRPGVAYCFRRFHGLVEDLVRGAWVRAVRDLKENQPVFGDLASLDEFLFGSERANLAVYRQILFKVQNGVCFYCGRRLDLDAAVDHFVPWSRYPVDLGHNFVLAHGGCNGKKGDRLAAFEHLERWCERNHRDGKTLDDAFLAQKIFADRRTSIQITRWAYGLTEAINGLVWVSGDAMVPLDARWRALQWDAN
jgi:5-methylcytosine-specific restriction endonuclease McrA